MKLMCTKCKVGAKKAVLDRYEHEKGIVLEHVDAYECPRCGEFVFTEQQMENIEERTTALKVHRFSFDRKVTISGRSLVINIPEDVARHMKLTKGTKTKLTPLDDRRFLVEIQNG